MEAKEEIVEEIKQQDPVPVTGGKRKSKRRVNPALGKWVAFVKKVQKEENISYKEAMTRAKARKDKGEKWMGGAPSGYSHSASVVRVSASPGSQHGGNTINMLKGGEGEEMEGEEMIFEDKQMDDMDDMEGGRRRRRSRSRRRRTQKRRGSKKRRRTRRR